MRRGGSLAGAKPLLPGKSHKRYCGTKALNKREQQSPSKNLVRSVSAGVEFEFGEEVDTRRERLENVQEALTRPFAKVQQGIESRVAADPDFIFKIIWEIVQDQFIIVFTVLGSCGLPMFWTPEQLANACLLHATAFFNDILLMYFLAPTASDSGAGRKSGEKKQGGKELAHMFEPVDASLGERLKCWLDKFFLYAPLGCLTALLSSVILNVFLNEPLNLTYLSKVGLVGLLHLGISSNTRYQMINGADVLYYKVLDKGAARGATIASRLVNQVAGGKLFLLLSTFVLG